MKPGDQVLAYDNFCLQPVQIVRILSMVGHQVLRVQTNETSQGFRRIVDASRYRLFPLGGA